MRHICENSKKKKNNTNVSMSDTLINIVIVTHLRKIDYVGNFLTVFVIAIKYQSSC